MRSGQELAPSPFWEGCQWVREPVSRHFFINQTFRKRVDFLLAFANDDANVLLRTKISKIIF